MEVTETVLPNGKVEILKGKYHTRKFNPKSGVAKFLVNDGNVKSTFYMRTPEELKTTSQFNSWLRQAGEDSGFIDVEIKYKLLHEAKRWKALKDEFRRNDPSLPISSAMKPQNAQEEYNIKILAEQGKLASKFKLN